MLPCKPKLLQLIYQLLSRAVQILLAKFLEKLEAKSKDQNSGKIGEILEK